MTPDPTRPRTPGTTRELSPARRRLIEMIQAVNYGRLEGLVVRDGEPVLAPPPRVVREYKFAFDNGPRPEARLADFPLKEQHRDLFRLLDEIRDGVLPLLSVKAGLPFLAEVAG